MKINRPKFYYAIPFFLILGALGVACAIPAAHPKTSQSERRELAEFPEFSWADFASGAYFGELSTWFSDTFPGREVWLEGANRINSLHGSSEIMISGTVPTSDEIPDVPEAGEDTEPLEVYVPTQATQPETAATEQTDPSAEASAAPETEETQAPTTWQGADAADAAEILKSSTAFQVGDAAYVYQNFSKRTTDNYASVLNQFVEKAEEMGVTVVSAPPPTAVGVMFQEEYQESLNSVSQFKIMDYLNSRLDERILKTDMLTALQAHNGEYIYFRTDHHWTPLGAYYGYRELCRVMGLTPVELDSLEEHDEGEFIGSLIGKVTRPNKLTTDNMTAYIPSDDITVTVTENNGGQWESPFYIRREDITKESKYYVYGADVPMYTFVNNSMEEGPSCVVIRDSFASCFIPYLTQHFKTIYAIDYRRYYNKSVLHMLEQWQPEYVIIMPYITAIEDEMGPDMIYRVLFSDTAP